MGFFESIKSVLSKYATFSGRASRSEYWFFALFCILWCWIPILNIILLLVFFIPGLAVAVRRLHDTGRTGWWILINLIPFIGSIVLLIFYCTDSQFGDNQYGPNPKGISGSTHKAVNDVNDAYIGKPKPNHKSVHIEESSRAYESTIHRDDNQEETVMASSYTSEKTCGHLIFDGKSYPLFIGRNVVGRGGSSSKATVQIETDDLYMSRQHCIIDVQNQSDGSLTTKLRNYQNKNGTAIDGQVVNNEVDVCLLGDCDITLGHTTIRYTRN